MPRAARRLTKKTKDVEETGVISSSKSAVSTVCWSDVLAVVCDALDKWDAGNSLAFRNIALSCKAGNMSVARDDGYYFRYLCCWERAYVRKMKPGDLYAISDMQICCDVEHRPVPDFEDISMARTRKIFPESCGIRFREWKEEMRAVLRWKGEGRVFNEEQTKLWELQKAGEEDKENINGKILSDCQTAYLKKLGHKYSEEEMEGMVAYAKKVWILKNETKCGVCNEVGKGEWRAKPVWALGMRVCSLCLRGNLVSSVVLWKRHGIRYEDLFPHICGKVWFFRSDHTQAYDAKRFSNDCLDFGRADHAKTSLLTLYFWKPHLHAFVDLRPALVEHPVSKEWVGRKEVPVEGARWVAKSVCQVVTFGAVGLRAAAVIRDKVRCLMVRLRCLNGGKFDGLDYALVKTGLLRTNGPSKAGEGWGQGIAEVMMGLPRLKKAFLRRVLECDAMCLSSTNRGSWGTIVFHLQNEETSRIFQKQHHQVVQRRGEYASRNYIRLYSNYYGSLKREYMCNEVGVFTVDIDPNAEWGVVAAPYVSRR